MSIPAVIVSTYPVQLNNVSLDSELDFHMDGDDSAYAYMVVGAMRTLPSNSAQIAYIEPDEYDNPHDFIITGIYRHFAGAKDNAYATNVASQLIDKMTANGVVLYRPLESWEKELLYSGDNAAREAVEVPEM